MSPERHAQIKRLFLATCELQEGERPAFLDHACKGDAELRAEIESLLKHHHPGSIIEASPRGEKVRVPTVVADILAAAVLASPGAPEAQPRFPAGTMISDRYRIVALLGKGGMGEVYRADDLTLAQPVALKFLRTAIAGHPAWLARLRSEVRVARGVSNPHVCRVHDIGESDGECFITMEYVDGEDLSSLLKRIGRLPSDKALDIARQLCAGLAAAHARGVLHRDLKPANIMLDNRGQVVITDFGLAEVYNEIEQNEIRAGTPAYMAPEQLAGREVTVRSDIYSLGLLLYELFTGSPAFHAETLAEYARIKDSTTPSPPSTIVTDMDPAVERVIMRCLRKDPRDRPASVLAVVAALPGGDPLAAALAAGETPSPELVAAAGGTGVIRSPLAIGGLAVFLAMLFIAVLLSHRTHPIAQARFDKDPRVLADKARELLDELPDTAPPAYEAFGLVEHRECPFVRPIRHTGDADVPEFAAVGDVTLAFWYHRSPEYLVPADALSVVFGDERVTPPKPPATHPEMTSLVLDSKGRILGLEVVPRPFDSPSEAVSAVDWSALLARAGFDGRTLRPTEPRTVPRVYADTRIAWLGAHPEDKTMTIRVEAAVRNGKPICLAVLSERPAGAELADFADLARRRSLAKNTRDALLTILIVISLPLARLNLRQARSDFRGALRLASFFFIIRLIPWLLQASHVPSLNVELGLVTAAIARALAESAMAWLFYVALEPFVRRFWPQTLIAWTRVLGGQLRDPLVGRSILVGALLGVFWVLVMRFDLLVMPWLGIAPRLALRPDDFFAALSSARQACAFCIDALRMATYGSLFLLLLLVLLRILLRRTWLADIVGTLLIAPLFVPRGSHPVVSLIVIGLGCVGVAMFVLSRFGIVPVVTAFFVAAILFRFPLTLDMRVWYTDLSLLAVAVSTGVAAYGFLTASSRRAITQPPLGHDAP
ncbi:MAG: serine/threonine protein kinase [Sedimentisphaerales bacterium]|nr:serine/threonine protein kinase [Sedimentisphaerales bacterium]